MKNIFVSVDIEGIWGMAAQQGARKDTPAYIHARENMINETNLVIEQLAKNGVENILVSDSHGSMDNLIPSKLNPRASFIVGNADYRALGMMEGIDSSFDGCMFIGYHAREGTIGAVLNHTMSSRYIYKIELNGIEAGETMLNAHLASYYNVPLLLVAGDDKYIEQSQGEFNDELITVETKKAINRELALSIPYDKLKQEYEFKIKQALNSKGVLLNKKDKYEIKITFFTEDLAGFVASIPTVTRIDNKTISIDGSDYLEAYKLLAFCLKACSVIR